MRRLRRSIILSAGAMRTPQLLMLPGIGPAKTLEEAGIQPYVINEYVGKNLQDRISFSITAQTRPLNVLFLPLPLHIQAPIRSTLIPKIQRPPNRPNRSIHRLQIALALHLASLVASAVHPNQALIKHLYKSVRDPALASPTPIPKNTTQPIIHQPHGRHTGAHMARNNRDSDQQQRIRPR
jgi:choline dehydrogenase-like flavoprotein